MHLLLMTFGPNHLNHQQAYFAIYSFLARKAGLKSINMITDMPQLYKNIEKHVNIIPVTSQQLDDWKGPYKYFWRIKIKAIELICSMHPNEAVLYLDSDTFLYEDDAPIRKLISENKAGMHLNEGPLKNFKTKTAKKMYADLHHAKVEGLNQPWDFNMWNAGAILNPNTKDQEELKLAFHICDELCRQAVIPYFIEQYTMSIAFEKTYGLSPLSNEIAHYWSNRDEWNKYIEKFLIDIYFQKLEEPELLQKFLQQDLRSLPERRIVKNTNPRLKKLVDKWFPDKEISYLPSKK